MLKFLSFSQNQRKLLIEQASAKLGIPPQSVEKDYWVCFILKIIFTHPSFSNAFTFKGGTSLSKGWSLIHRFSEDIDLVIHKNVLDGIDEENYNYMDTAISNSNLKKLHKKGRSWVQDFFLNALSGILSELLNGIEWSLNVDADVADGMCLLFYYETFWNDTYICSRIKIEMGPQPDNWPSVSVSITPFVYAQFPNLTEDPTFEVSTITPHRTLWEKACLLHEIRNWATHPNREGRMPASHLSRHYYDLYCLLLTPWCQVALDNDNNVFEHCVKHRQSFFFIRDVDYSTMTRGQLNILPHESHRAVWLTDYDKMRQDMIYGNDAPPFEEIEHQIKTFQDKFNSNR